MRNLFLSLLILVSSAVMAGSTVSFDVVNVVLGEVKNKLPEGCLIEKSDPVIVSRSPVIVNYTYTLSKNERKEIISFEQSQNDFVITSDEETYEEVKSADGQFALKLGVDSEVLSIRVNDLECSSTEKN